MSPPAAARLAAVAGWDVGLLARAERALRTVAGRLPDWRARLEGVARSLEPGAGWAGPAARSTAAAVRELSAVGWAVEGALVGSSEAFGRLLSEAAQAQELAREALGRADDHAGGPAAALVERRGLPGVVALVPDARPVPSQLALAVAESALAHASAAAAAAEDAGAALTGVGVRDAFVPADFPSLAARVPAARPMEVSCPDGPPDAVAAWWAALPLTAQLTALRTDPAALGGRDGLPAWVRDRANRLGLAAALADPDAEPYAAFTARAVARRIEEEEAAGRQVQLHLLDLARDRVALGVGDLDTADAVVVLVPGIWNSPGDDLDALLDDARAVAGAASDAAPALTVATLLWLGYDSPAGPAQILGRGRAWDGGPALAASLAGLRAGRAAVDAPDPRTTVLAHSYGTVVVDEAADVPGRLAADAVVLLGSPGMEDDAASLEVPEVYDAAAPDDPVAATGWFGDPTGSASYGSTGLPVEADTGHSGYYDDDRPTLAALGEVVAGVRSPR